MVEWRQARLSDVVRPDTHTTEVAADQLYPIVGVLNRGRGLLLRDSIRGSDTAYKQLNIIKPGQIVYSRLKAFEGAITVVPWDTGLAFASQEFPTFTCSENLVPEFFRLLTTMPSLWDALRSLSTGMGGRRERVKPAAFLSIAIALPVPSEQRRIVAVITAVDSQIEALASEHQKVSTARAVFEVEACAALDGSVAVSLGKIADVVGGVTKDKKREESEGNVAVPYLRVANVQRGYLDLSDVASIRVAPPMLKTRALREGDLLLNEGGDRDKLGRGWVWEKQLPVCVHQNHVHRARIKDQNLYLPKFVSIWANTVGPDWFFNNGGQTNGIASISISKVRQFPVPMAPMDAQRRVVAVSEALRGVDDCLAVELAALRAVRADLLTNLLSQEVTVDAAVEQFVKVA